MVRTRTVYVVDPAVSVETAVELIGIDARDRSNVRVFCPERKSRAVLASAFRERALPYELLAFESVGGEHDDLLFGFCQAVAEGYSACVRKEWRWSHFVALQDKLVAAIRGPYILGHLLSNEPGTEVALVSPLDEPANRARWDLLMTSFGNRLRAIGGAPPVRNAAHEVWDGVQRGGLRQYDEAALRKLEMTHSRRRLCLSIAAANPQYVGAAAPFIERLAKSYNLVISNASQEPCGREALNDQLPHLVEDLAFLDLVKVPVKKASLADVRRMRDIGQAATVDVAGYETMDERFGPAIRDLALRECTRLERSHRAIWEQARRLVACVDGVIVVPGRHMPSNILVAAAHAADVPTFDVQTGTITRTRRFLAPAAKTVFALNDESARMFARLGKTDGLLPIGSPKIDRDLAPYKALGQQEARHQLGLNVSGDLWVFASQPVGVALMTKAIGVVCDAAAAHGGVAVLIKMHPNETAPYREAYEELARSHTISITIDQRTKSPVAIVASDVVFTHFSSVAIEAYAMGKPAIAVNPSHTPLPFDLAASGIAPEVSTVDEIFSALERLSARKDAFDVLRDGRALDRAQQAIEGSVGPARRSKVRGLVRCYYWRLPLAIRKYLTPAARRVRRLLAR